MKTLDEIKEIKRGAEDELLALPGVTGVGVGKKKVGGEKTDENAIIVYVEKKKPLDEIPKDQRVPKTKGGVKTDVVERKFVLHYLAMRVEDIERKADTGTYDPLLGGISIGPCRSLNITGDDVACQGVPGPGNYLFVGTLGAFVTDNVSGDEMMLSNFHVMALDNNWSVGDDIAQPSRVDGGNCPADIVGQLQRASLGSTVDCAVASHSARGWACDIVDIGAIDGQAVATDGMAVRKRGRTTGLTHGTVDDVSLTVNIDYCNGLGNVTLTNQIGIAVDTSQSTQFGNGGDSGSVVVDGNRRVVGLYFAGTPDGTYGVANPIQDVLTALNVSLCTAGTLKFIDDPTLKFVDDPTLKFADDPTLKFADDPTLKFADDPTLKFADDPTLKFADDPTLKFSDDVTFKFSDDGGTLKFADDITTKFSDDQTLKFADDVATAKFQDDAGTDPRLDPVKSPAFDKRPDQDVAKQPASDMGGQPPFGGQPPLGGQPPFGGQPPLGGRGGLGGPYGGGAAPFILATPHHSMAYVRQMQAQGTAQTQGQAQARGQAQAQAQALGQTQGQGRVQTQGQGQEAQYQDTLREYERVLTRMYEAYQQGTMGAAEYEQFVAGCNEYQQLLAEAQGRSPGR